MTIQRKFLGISMAAASAALAVGLLSIPTFGGDDKQDAIEACITIAGGVYKQCRANADASLKACDIDPSVHTFCERKHKTDMAVCQTNYQNDVNKCRGD